MTPLKPSCMKRVVRLAIQLGREDQAQYVTLDVIARDCVAIYTALERRRGRRSDAIAKRALKRAQKLLAQYGAILLSHDGKPAIRFTSGRWSNVADEHKFYL